MLIMKRGDTRKAIRATITDEGEAVPLEDCDVLISIEKTVERAYCTIEDAPNGKVVFALEAGMTDKAGVFNYEFIVVFPDGREFTAPNDSYLQLKIMDEVV